MPSGGRGRKFESSHPDQFFFIELASCCLFGRYHELTISPLPKFCRIPLTGKLPASRNPGRYFACLPTCSAREHCLGSTVETGKPPGSKLDCRNVTCCYKRRAVGASVASIARQCTTEHNPITQKSRKTVLAGTGYNPLEIQRTVFGKR